MAFLWYGSGVSIRIRRTLKRPYEIYPATIRSIVSLLWRAETLVRQLIGWHTGTYANHKIC